MSLLASIGGSSIRSSSNATLECLQQIKTTLGDAIPNILFVFASAQNHNQQEILGTISRIYNNTSIVGCSSAGEITSTLGALDNSLAMLALVSDQINFSVGYSNSADKDSHIAGVEFANSIVEKTKSHECCCLVFSEGLHIDGNAIVEGIQEVLSPNAVLAGAAAADNTHFRQTYQYYNNQVLTNSIVGVGITGNLSLAVGVEHGWIPIGTSRIVTKAKRNIIYELDSKPAIQMYEEQFGIANSLPDNSSDSFAMLGMAYPLGILSTGEYLIRAPLHIGSNGEIICNAQIPVGSEVYLMIGSKDEAITAAKNAALSAIAQLGEKKPKAAFMFSSIARKKLLLSNKQAEISSVQSVIGNNVPLIGFYTYGEIAPNTGISNRASFHNESNVIVLLGE